MNKFFYQNGKKPLPKAMHNAVYEAYNYIKNNTPDLTIFKERAIIAGHWKATFDFENKTGFVWSNKAYAKTPFVWGGGGGV